MAEPSSSGPWLSALTVSHERLAAVTNALGPEEIAGPSYDTDWSIAQVLSHLGSGAEIFGLFFTAGLRREPVPNSEFQPIWDRWNAKDPASQAVDALAADRRLLDELVGVDEEQRGAWNLEMSGAVQHFDDLLRLRLGEHALHTWDVAVIGDPSATIEPEAVALLIDTVGGLVDRVGRPTEQPVHLHITTDEPHREFVLDADGSGTSLRQQADGADAAPRGALHLPAEALVRLVYGRLDPEHTPELDAADVDLGAIRALFPGF